MGYFSKRKHYERVHFFLDAMAIALGLIAVLSLFKDNNIVIHYIKAYRFHYYLLAFVMCSFALAYRCFLHSFAFIALIIINYFAIASFANVFHNYNQPGEGIEFNIIYQSNVTSLDDTVKEAIERDVAIIGINNENSQKFSEVSFFPYKNHNPDRTKKSFMLTNLDITKSGKIVLTDDYEASYMGFILHDKSFVVVNVDLKGIERKYLKSVFDKLTKFVLAQDDPVAVVGNFGTFAWSDVFEKFLIKTELSVKNRIILGDGSSNFSIMGAPYINILGFESLNLEDIIFLPREGNPSHPILFKLKIS